MSTITFSHPLLASERREPLVLHGIPSERTAKQLPSAAGDLIRSVVSVLDDLVSRCIENRSCAEFEASRENVFPHYFRSVLALSDLARIVVPTHMLETLTDEFYCELESDFRNQGLAAFGAAVRDQAIFTVWTLRKISDLCSRINRTEISDDSKKVDKELSVEFAYWAISTRFHLHCLQTSLRLKKPIYPEVLVEMVDGLRGVVNAYALARRGLDLREPQSEPLISAVEWDAEEQQLLDEATFDEGYDAEHL